jgi:hypothetical protein
MSTVGSTDWANLQRAGKRKYSYVFSAAHAIFKCVHFYFACPFGFTVHLMQIAKLIKAADATLHVVINYFRVEANGHF